MPANDRLARAKARRTGTGPSSSSGSDVEVKRIEVSGIATFAAIFFLLSIGASVASSYIMLHNPDCMGSSSTTSSSSNANNNLRTTPGAAAAPAKPVGRVDFPPTCTAEQKQLVAKQLPPNKCYEAQYKQVCSITQATAKSKCKDSFWMREVYSQQLKVDRFNAIFANNGCQDNNLMIDALAIGSHDVAKFDVQKWTSKTDNCLTPMTTTLPAQPVLGLCVTHNGDAIGKVKTAKTNTGLTTEIKEMQQAVGATAFGNIKTLDAIVEEEGLQGAPIHYLKILGEDLNVMMGAKKTLDRVRYLEFETHYQGAWDSSASLEYWLNRKLAYHNLVCYWNGGDNGLWRITDCWQTHYAQKWWGYVACVSSVHEESKPLLAKMEEVFAETLKKDAVFGA